VPTDSNSEELAAVVQEIRERVRARYPERVPGAGVVLPDLLPILHERDAAEAKVAAIGAVNPRPSGLLNSLVQAVKNLVSRLLDWHVRDQIDFNRATVRGLGAVLEALNENNRALSALAARADSLSKTLDEGNRATEALGAGQAALAARLDGLSSRLDGLASSLDELLEVRDIRSHWAQWRVEWERKLDTIERHFFRNVAELHGAFQHRATVLETSLRDTAKLQHSDFLAALWRGIRETRTELERLIHAELRLVRQRAALVQPAPLAPAVAGSPVEAPPIDWLQFAARFRGDEDYVRERQRFYLPHFAKCRQVLDIGCGRGEFLELLKQEEIPARGIDLSAESVALCRSRGLDAEVADLFAYLAALPDEGLDGIFCAQVVEHLPPARLPEMLRLAAAKLAPGGLLAVETPNPECLAILASHFYLDPTHQHPVPALLLAFYLEEFGFGELQTHRLSPAAETMPALNSLPPDFRDAFFGALDYAILAKKL
jgi:O-antigen chain-terminating methyltransferase